MNNIVNNGSSTSNFMKNVKLEFVQNKKALLLGMISIWGLYIFIGFWRGWNGAVEETGEMITFSIMAMIISIVAASMTFSNMKTKEQRIFNLMIPASMESKFMTRWIAVVPMLFIVLLIGFYLGSFTRIGTRLMICPDTDPDSYLMKVINPFYFYTGHGDEDGALIFCLSFGVYFFYQSLYLLGAIMWPKLSFLKTFATIYVLQTVLGIIFLSSYNSQSLIVSHKTVIPSLWVLASVMAMLTLLCYYLSYRKYKASQVVYKLF